MRCSKACIERLWMAPLMPVVLVMSELTIHPSVLNVWMFGLYLLSICSGCDRKYNVVVGDFYELYDV